MEAAASSIRRGDPHLGRRSKALIAGYRRARPPAKTAEHLTMHLNVHKLARIALFGFILTFVIARAFVFLIMSRKIPNFYFFLQGTHVHHLNYGIFLLAAIGGYAVFRRLGRARGRGDGAPLRRRDGAHVRRVRDVAAPGRQLLAAGERGRRDHRGRGAWPMLVHALHRALRVRHRWASAVLLLALAGFAGSCIPRACTWGISSGRGSSSSRRPPRPRGPVKARTRTSMDPGPGPSFLTAEWRYLAMLNYDIDPSVLAPFVPGGTELDTFGGRTIVSIVGFLFLDTRVFGFPIPFHRNFEEVNLRFYVRRRTGDGWRRAVVFIKEIVPRFAIAATARAVYGEKYVAVPMGHHLQLRTDSGEPLRDVAYTWRIAGRGCSIPHVRARGAEGDRSGERGRIHNGALLGVFPPQGRPDARVPGRPRALARLVPLGRVL